LDRTHSWFHDEDEANRELVSVLRAWKFDALYHPELTSGRTADAYFNGSLVEGKLNPHNSEIDRLVGQVEEYVLYPYFVHVVIYGDVSEQVLKRIENLAARYSDKVFIAYVYNANRNRIYRG